jgi:hypothetical protein
MATSRLARLRLDLLEARDNPSLVLLPDQTLAALRQSATANTPQWQAYKLRLDQNLNVITTHGSYQGSALSWIADYALGYQVLKTIDPATAANYADKAIGLMNSGLHDYQKSDYVSRQFLARGDGTTTTFTLPNSDFVSSTLQAYLSDVSDQPVVRSTTGAVDVVRWYEDYLKVSNTADGPANYVEGTDWIRTPTDENAITWLPNGKAPVPGSTYHVTIASLLGTTPTQVTVSGNTIKFAQAPRSDQAVFVEYLYGTHAADGSTLAYQQTSSGDGGEDSIFVDDTYSSRFLGKYMALGYDWLSGYVGFSSSLKSETADLLVKWYDDLQQYGYYINSPVSNYGAGSYVSDMLTALALADQGDSRGPALVNDMVGYRQTYLLPDLQTPDGSVEGGFWAEGWNYGQMSARNLLIAGLAFEEAGLSTASPERQWATDVVYDLISEQPTQSTVYDGGDGFAYPANFPNKDLFYLLSAATTDATARGYANYIIQQYPGQQTGDFQDLLFRDPSATANTWTSAPLQHRADGTGLVTARADWSYSSTWMSFQLGNLLSADHQSYTPGQLQIQRGGDALLANAEAYLNTQIGAPKSTYGNSVIIDDNGDGLQNYRYSMGYWYWNGMPSGLPGVTTTAYEAGTDFLYVAGDYAAAYSNSGSPGAGGPATKLTRQIVYLRPDFVIVHDRAGTVKDSYTKKAQWNFLVNPTVSGNTWSESVGSSKLFGAAFSSQPISTAVTPVTYGGKTVYTLSTANSNPTLGVQYTTAFQTAPSSTSSMVGTTRVASADGRMEGVQMGDYVVMFGTDGTVDLAAGSITYNFSGTDAVKHLLTDLSPGAVYQVKVDGGVLGTFTASDQGTITFDTAAGLSSVLVILTSSALTATPDSYSTLHDRTLQVSAANGVLVNDFSPTGSAMTAALVSGPSHGTVSLSSNGAFTYHPAAGFAGTDTFTYRASDGTANSAPATVTINVTDAAPTAVPASYTVASNQPRTVNSAGGVLVGAADADGDSISAILASGPSHGTVQLNADGSFVYTPATNYVGADAFSFMATDGIRNSAATTVSLTVTNSGPLAKDDSYSVNHDHVLAKNRAAGVLANDLSPSGKPLTAKLVAKPAHGTVLLSGSGSFVYTPNRYYYGSDSFTYKVTDGTDTSLPATVAITVVDTPPVAAADTYTLQSDSRFAVTRPLGLLSNDHDAENDRLTAVLVSPPAHGLLTLSSSGAFVYQPQAGYVGPDSFTYKDHTTTNDSNPAAVNLTVLARPQVTSVTVNGGSAQRSRVTSLTIAFDRLVALDAGAFVLSRSDGTVPTVTWNITTVNGSTVASAIFSGHGTEFGSLADGKWTLRIRAGRVHRADNTETVMLADYRTSFWRLFGDANGDGTVDAADQTAFQAAMGQTDALSLAMFDWNGDGAINATDQAAFNKRFGKKI